MNSIDRLNAEGLVLPTPEAPAFDYLPLSVHAGVIWMAGQLAKENGRVPILGQVASVVSVEEAARQMTLCALQALSRLQNEFGSLDSIERVLHLNAYVACPPDFDGISPLADHASRVFVIAFGDAGRHPRSVLGVNRLPQNAPVMIDLRLALNSST